MIDRAVIPPDPTMCYSDDPEEAAELGRLFQSTDPLDSRQAADLCRGCYFLESCGRTALKIARSPEGRWAGIPSGTWGGVLFRNGTPAHEWHRPKRKASA